MQCPFYQNLDNIQHNSALAITKAIRGTSKGKLYQDLGLESLVKKGLYRKLCFKQSPKYFLNIAPVSDSSYFIRYVENAPSFK